LISGSDLKNGMTILHNGEVWRVEYFQHVKPGKGSAFTRTKLKNLESGGVLEHTFKSKDSIEPAHVERKDMEFLYKDGSMYYFMDPETYEQFPFAAERCAHIAPYLKENMRVTVTKHGDRVLDISMPNFVELAVAKTDPGLRGDTASGGSKPATLETGGVVNVPLFIEEGDLIQIDTRTGDYLGRAGTSS
jgi:elongation factor P